MAGGEIKWVLRSLQDKPFCDSMIFWFYDFMIPWPAKGLPQGLMLVVAPVRTIPGRRIITLSTDVPHGGAGGQPGTTRHWQPLITGADTCWDAQVLCNSLTLVPADTLGILQQQLRCSGSEHTECLVQIKAIPGNTGGTNDINKNLVSSLVYIKELFCRVECLLNQDMYEEQEFIKRLCHSSLLRLALLLLWNPPGNVLTHLHHYCHTELCPRTASAAGINWILTHISRYRFSTWAWQF